MSSSVGIGQQVGDPVTGWSPRERPRPGPFEGRFCTVVPLEAAHAEPLFATCAGDGNDELWTYLADGPFADVETFRSWIARTVADPVSVGVAVCGPAGTAEGVASYLRIDEANGSVEVGGILFGRALQRTPAATEAMYLMARHVLEDLGYRRYEWKCDDLNEPSRTAALRLGFHYEGTFRHAVVHKGRNRDTAWYSVTDAEWPALAAAHRGWLHPDDVDAAGRQRRRLAECR